MALKIHHLNCGSMCPHGARLVNGTGGLLENGHMICHCLLIESNQGLILVDTGIGTEDAANPKRMGRLFTSLVRPDCNPKLTALAQVEALGFSRDDVRHIVITHMDVDHAGGLPDFPDAQVHIFQDEYDAITQPNNIFEGNRYCPHQWAHQPDWVTYAKGGDRWFGFDSIRTIPGCDAEVLLVPLVGHSRGHCGIAVKSENGWLLNAGDAYAYHTELEDPPSCPPALKLFQNVVKYDNKIRRQNLQRVRELAAAHSDEIKIFCAHDPIEFDRIQTLAN